MSTVVPLTKLHGTRNDFILIDHRDRQFENYSVLARSLCDRHSSIGADGLLIILPSESADVRMRIFNPDGSEAEMCGNGIRCVAAYLFEDGAPPDLHVETLAGVIETQARRDGDRYTVRVRLPAPQIMPAGIPNGYAVQAGNPNVVIFGDSFDGVDLPAMGPLISSKYRDGANVHVAVPCAPDRLEVHHWERGVGPTLSCGTGAVAAAGAAIYRGVVRSPVAVIVPGGELIVEWDGAGDAWLTGEAVRVFDTTVRYDDVVAN
ncbi:MAG: diaminopimelate epimerase [Candidatus Eremiobacteraeota bacterium]|nr:diaminopimelate epimerase [Candidatus Eremiobacteraeota bacterium]